MANNEKSFTEYIQESIQKAGILMTEMAEDIAKDGVSLHLDPNTEHVLTVSKDYPVSKMWTSNRDLYNPKRITIEFTRRK